MNKLLDSFFDLIDRKIKVVLAIIGFTLVLIFNPISTNKRFEKRIYKEAFTAVVENKYFNQEDRKRRFIVLRDIDNQKEFEYFTPNLNKTLFELVEKGDTIKKIENSFKIFIINSQGKQNLNIERRKNSFNLFNRNINI